MEARGLDELRLPEGEGLIVSNPPWGRRVGEVEDLEEVYAALGDALKRRAAGWTAWLLLGERRLMAAIGLSAARRVPVFNGPVECRFVRYDLYRG